jgi:TRAP-type C4-dicarboxylate transport system permease small subunit
MSEHAGGSARPTDAVGRALFGVSKSLAIFGGFLCSGMAVLVVVSVTGRYLFAAPVPGDNDLVAIISGCAVFAFLPYCQMTRGNVVVDFFTSNVRPGVRAALDGVGALFYLLIAVLFTWRLYFGALELYESGQVLAAFNFYRWWTLPFSIFCMAVLIVVIAYTLANDIRDVTTDKPTAMPSGEGQ